MNEFREIVRSVLLSNDCAGSENCQCKKYRRLTLICLGRVIGLSSTALYGMKHKFVSPNTAGLICDALGLDINEYEGSISKATNFDNRVPVGRLTGRRKFLPGRKRFGLDVEAARTKMACENNCCKNYMSVGHAGEMVGISGSLWRHIEYARKVYSFELFLQMCEAMQLDPRDYVGPAAPVAKGSGDDVAAMNWLRYAGGRIAFGVGELPVTVFVAPYGSCEGETLAEAVAWMKRKIDSGKKVA